MIHIKSNIKLCITNNYSLFMELSIQYLVSITNKYISIVSFTKYLVSITNNYISIVSFTKYLVSITNKYISIVSFTKYCTIALDQ